MGRDKGGGARERLKELAGGGEARGGGGGGRLKALIPMRRISPRLFPAGAKRGGGETRRKK